MPEEQFPGYMGLEKMEAYFNRCRQGKWEFSDQYGFFVDGKQIDLTREEKRFLCHALNSFTAIKEWQLEATKMYHDLWDNGRKKPDV